MKILFTSSLLIISISATFLEEQEAKFHAFKLKHGKTYMDQAEEVKRFNIFKSNVLNIEEHNALYEQRKVSYKKGINQFTDMTAEEFRAMLTLKASKRPFLEATPYVKSGLELPSSIDWREKGQVTKVKAQGFCGACWAFSITGSSEAAYYRKSGKLVSLSEQQLVDCTIGINEGCDGGELERTFRYVRQQGLQSESSYPYEGVDGHCKYSASSIVAKITNFTSIIQDEDALLDAVATVGPVSISMDADYLDAYESGVYEEARCNVTDTNHSLLAVGYGTLDGKDYWLVKNSWGDTWGDHGYLKLARGTNECGVAEDSVFPTIS